MIILSFRIYINFFSPLGERCCMMEIFYLHKPVNTLVFTHICMCGGPRVVVSTAAFHARVRGSVPGLGGLKETKMFLPHPRVKVSIVGGLRDREVACSASDRQGSNFESCVWRTVSSQSSHHPQEVLLAQFSLYVHKGGLKPDSFHFIFTYMYILLFTWACKLTRFTETRLNISSICPIRTRLSPQNRYLNNRYTHQTQLFCRASRDCNTLRTK